MCRYVKAAVRMHTIVVYAMAWPAVGQELAGYL